MGPQPQRGGCIVTVDTTGALKFTNKLAPVPTPKCAAVPKLEPILNGQRAITGDTALRLSNFFGTSGEFWLNLQSLYDLRVRACVHNHCMLIHI